MEAKTKTPKSETKSNSQRNFLLTAIGLLATLILSSLCVIGLLVSRPSESKAARTNDTLELTADPEDVEVGEQLSGGETAESALPEAVEEDEDQQGSRRIIDYPEPRAGENKIISYPPSRNGDHRIVTYDFNDLVSNNTMEEDPLISHRIINYDDGG